MEGAKLMADFVEIINPKTRSCTVIKNGEVVDVYLMEQCDSCSKLSKADEFGFIRGVGGEKQLWFCGLCR
jgi:hypothetical protein